MPDRYQLLRDVVAASSLPVGPTFPRILELLDDLLKERDALREALSEAQTRIAAIGYPASPDGEYSKDGEWTFSDAVPRAVDAEEVKAAFLVLRAALADGEAQS